MYNNFIEQSMFKRFFSFSGQIQATFDECFFDKTHRFCNLRRIISLAQRLALGETIQSQRAHDKKDYQTNLAQSQIQMNNKKKSKEKNIQRKADFYNCLFKRINSKDDVLIIKGLVVAHTIIRLTKDSELVSALLDVLDKFILEDKGQEYLVTEGDSISVGLENGKKEFIQRNVISFYSFYLKKYLLSFETVNKIQSYCQPQKLQINPMQTINNGFITLNLMNYILRSQHTFNKTGRYYLQHKQYLNLFIVYLNDVIIYNDYIKVVTKLAVRSIKGCSNQLLSHHFLFVLEAQKTSDRLYQFFYNRYYFKEVKYLIEMPTFLSIQNQDYDKIVSYVKKRDKQLVITVKNSKYEQARSKSCYSKSNKTEGESSTEISSNPDFSPIERKVLTYVKEDHRAEKYRNASMAEKKRSLSTYKS